MEQTRNNLSDEEYAHRSRHYLSDEDWNVVGVAADVLRHYQNARSGPVKICARTEGWCCCRGRIKKGTKARSLRPLANEGLLPGVVQRLIESLH